MRGPDPPAGPKPLRRGEGPRIHQLRNSFQKNGWRGNDEGGAWPKLGSFRGCLRLSRTHRVKYRRVLSGSTWWLRQAPRDQGRTGLLREALQFAPVRAQSQSKRTGASHDTTAHDRPSGRLDRPPVQPRCKRSSFMATRPFSTGGRRGASASSLRSSTPGRKNSCPPSQAASRAPRLDSPTCRSSCC